MIKAKKSLGQNFLKNKKILKKIVEVAEIKKGDFIIEIGPGKGALTEELLKKDIRLLAIEKDKRLIPFLEDKFADEIAKKKLKIIEVDALELDYKKLNLVNHGFSIVANLPYYITGKFLSSTLSSDIQPKNIVLMLQEEVVKRITGGNQKHNTKKQKNKENILSISVKIYADAKYILPVSRKNFQPEPAVNSAVLGLYNISKKFFLNNNVKEEEFFSFVKQIFSNKRKQILKNIKNKTDKKKLALILEKKNIDIKIRAEDLSLGEIKEIFLLFQDR